jgi:integrase
MPGLRNKLSVATVRATTKVGKHADGAGLYLQVTRHPVLGTIRKSWLVRYRASNGRIRETGIGSAEDVSLADARTKASAIRQGVRSGTDTIEVRLEERREVARQKAAQMTFQQCAEAYVAAHETRWRNPKHRAQWTSTLTHYAYPVFGAVAVEDVSVAMVMKVLDPIWATKTETASRIRGRIENVLDWAAVRGYRSGDNPARWRGHLEKALPARTKSQRVKHHAALPIDGVPPFMANLRKLDSLGALAFEFAILTACRTGEVIGARWEEMNLEDASWTIPAERMKAARIHRVPLSGRCLAILRQVRKLDPVFVFPAQAGGKPVSNMIFLMTLRRMERTDLTAHGFRSTFRDWAAERTEFQNEVAEAALAHVVGNKVEAAYRRGDLFEKRRALMEAWAAFALGEAMNS